MPAKKDDSLKKPSKKTTKKVTEKIVEKTPTSKKPVAKKRVTKKEVEAPTVVKKPRVKKVKEQKTDIDMINIFIDDKISLDSPDIYESEVDKEINQKIMDSSMKLDLVSDQKDIYEDVDLEINNDKDSFWLMDDNNQELFVDLPDSFWVEEQTVLEEKQEYSSDLMMDLPDSFILEQEIVAEEEKNEKLEEPIQETSYQSLESPIELESQIETIQENPEEINVPMISSLDIPDVYIPKDIVPENFSQEITTNTILEKHIDEEKSQEIPVLEEKIEKQESGLLDLSDISTEPKKQVETISMWLDVWTIQDVATFQHTTTRKSSAKWLLISMFSFLMLCVLAWAVYFVYDVMDPNRELLNSILWGAGKSETPTQSYTFSSSSESSESLEDVVLSWSDAEFSWDSSSSLYSSWENVLSLSWDENSSVMTWESFTWDSSSSDEFLLSEESSSSQSLTQESSSSSQEAFSESSSSENSSVTSSTNEDYASRLEKILWYEEDFQNLLKTSKLWWETVARKMLLVWLKKSKNLKSALENGEDFDIKDLDSQLASLDRLLLSASKKIDE